MHSALDQMTGFDSTLCFLPSWFHIMVLNKEDPPIGSTHWLIDVVHVNQDDPIQARWPSFMEHPNNMLVVLGIKGFRSFMLAADRRSVMCEGASGTGCPGEGSSASLCVWLAVLPIW